MDLTRFLELERGLIGDGPGWSATQRQDRVLPIQRLAEATRAVSEGRFDVRVDSDAPDELGVLVGSFNHMMEELRVGKIDVERSTRDLQQSNIELEGRRRYIETILESIPSGVISLDRHGFVTNINAAAVTMFDLADRVWVGAHYSELFGGKEFLYSRRLAGSNPVQRLQAYRHWRRE